MISINTTKGKTFLSEKGLIRADFDKEAMTFSATFEDGRTVSITNAKSVHRHRFSSVKSAK